MIGGPTSTLAAQQLNPADRQLSPGLQVSQSLITLPVEEVEGVDVPAPIPPNEKSACFPTPQWASEVPHHEY